LFGRGRFAVFELDVFVLDAKGGADAGPAFGEFAVGDDQGALAGGDGVDDAGLGGGGAGAGNGVDVLLGLEDVLEELLALVEERAEFAGAMMVDGFGQLDEGCFRDAGGPGVKRRYFMSMFGSLFWDLLLGLS